MGTRSTLVFPDERVWWDVAVLESDRRFEFRWPWLPGEVWETTVSVHLERAELRNAPHAHGRPFRPAGPGVLDAYTEALEGWGEALAWLLAASWTSPIGPAAPRVLTARPAPCPMPD